MKEGAVAEQESCTIYGTDINLMATIYCENPCVLQQPRFWRFGCEECGLLSPGSRFWNEETELRGGGKRRGT